MKKRYLGDGVYVQEHDYGLLLTTENGIEVLDKIYLEPEVYLSLVQFIQEISERNASQSNNS